MRQLWCLPAAFLFAVGGLYGQVCANGDCAESEIVLNQSTVDVSHEAGTAQFSVSFTNPACRYIVRNLVPWIESIDGNAGESFFACTPDSGNTITFQLTVSANPDLSERVGLVRIGGRSVTIRQAARPCEYLFTTPPLPADIPDEGTTGSLEATASAGCTAGFAITYLEPDNVGWLTLNVLDAQEPGDRDAVYTLEYIVALSEDAFERNAEIHILDGPGGSPTGVSYLITQEAAICKFTATPTEFSFDAEGGAATVTIDTESGCAWSLVGVPDWVTFSQTSGTEIANLTFQVEPAEDDEDLFATITVEGPPDSEGDSFTISRAGCTLSLSENDATFESGAATGEFDVITESACGYDISSVPEWVSINTGPFTGPATISYSISANPGTEQRVAKLEVGSAFYNIVQNGCNFTVSPSELYFNGEGVGDNNTIEVEVGDECRWLVNIDVNWITASVREFQTGSGSFRISLAPNRGNAERTGLISIGNQSVVVRQGTGSVFAFESASYADWERNQGIDVAILRTGLNNESVSVSVRVDGISAEEGSDFPAFTQRVTFLPGSTREIVTIPVIEDGNPEPNERFRAVLFNPDENATLGAQIEAELEILDLLAPTINQVLLRHDFYGSRTSGAHFARGDQVRVILDAEDTDGDPQTQPILYVNNVAVGNQPFFLDTAALGTGSIRVQAEDIEKNRVEREVTFEVVPQPEPPTLATAAWSARRGEPFTDDLDDTYFYDFNPVGLPGTFGQAPVPLLYHQGRFPIDVYRVAGDFNRPETLVVSTPRVVELTITANPEDPLRFRSMVPWFSHRLDGGSLAQGNFRFTSVLVLTNTGPTTARVRVSARRALAGGNDRSALRQAADYSLAPGQQLVLDAENDAFIGDLFNQQFNSEPIWSADGNGMALLVESDSSFVTAGYATYSGSNSAKPSQASPARAELVDLAAAGPQLVFQNLPGGGDEEAVLVVVNTGSEATSVQLEFFDDGGFVSSRETAPLEPWAPQAIVLSDGDLARSGFAVVSAVDSASPLLGSAFFFNSSQEPAMAPAVTMPTSSGPREFFLPWVSYNLNGGTGLDGDFAFRSRLVVNNLSPDQSVTLSFSARRGNGEQFQATRELAPMRQGVYDSAALFGAESGSGMAVTLRASHALVGVNLATLGGRRNLPEKSVATSPAQANAATYLQAGRQLVFGLVNDGRHPQIQPAAIIMNLGDQPVAPLIRAFNEDGVLAELQLESPIEPGAPFVLLFGDGDDVPGQLAYLSLPRTLDVSLFVEGDQFMTGSLFLNAPQYLETAMAPAVSTTKIKRANFAKESRLIQGDVFDLRVTCAPCDGLSFTINGNEQRFEISENDTYRFQSKDLGLLDRLRDQRTGVEPGVYSIEMRPVLDGQPLNEVTLIDLQVDIRSFFPDDNFYVALGAPITRADLQSKFIVEVENQALDLTGISQLENLFSLKLTNITASGDQPLDLDFSQFEILHEVLLTVDANGTNRGAGIRSIVLPQQQLLREINIEGVDDLESIRFGERNGEDRLFTDFEAIFITDCPNFRSLDLSKAEFALTPLIQGSNCPEFRCLAVPEVRTTATDGVTEAVPLFLDLNDSGFTRFDNPDCGGLDNSLLSSGIADDFVIVNTLDGVGCEQVPELEARQIFILQSEDSACLE